MGSAAIYTAGNSTEEVRIYRRKGKVLFIGVYWEMSTSFANYRDPERHMRAAGAARLCPQFSAGICRALLSYMLLRTSL